jgi:hypothetical protein
VKGEFAAAVARTRAAQGLPPVDDPLMTWVDESRAAQGLPPELAEWQVDAARAILAGTGVVL